MTFRLTLPKKTDLLEKLPLETVLEVERALSGLVRQAEALEAMGAKVRPGHATSRLDAREVRVTDAVDLTARHGQVLSVQRVAAAAG